MKHTELEAKIIEIKSNKIGFKSVKFLFFFIYTQYMINNKDHG